MAERAAQPETAGSGNGSVASAPPAQQAPPAPMELNVTSDPATLAQVRQACERFCVSAGLSEAAAGEVGLVVNEAMANVMRHAYAGATDRPIRVTAERVDGAVQVTL